MGILLRDFLYGSRMLGKSPGFTAAVVVTLALGIGANTTIFSWINSTLLNPIPGVRDTGTMVTLVKGGSAATPILFSYLDYQDLRARNRSFAALTAFGMLALDLTGSGKPEHVWGALTAVNYFDVLGVRPFLGRGFLPAEEEQIGGAPVAVLSYRLWQTRFGADRAVLGRTIGINRHPYTVIGVAPPLFQGTITGLRVDLWVPMVMRQQIIPADWFPSRDAGWLIPLGKLRPGVSGDQAQAEINVLMQQIVEAYPETHRGNNQVMASPLWRAPGANAFLYRVLPLLAGVAALVLLLACTNVANLLLVRALGRRREMAVRLALGASRGRLALQFLVENLALALAGATAALLLTMWSSRILMNAAPTNIVPIALNVRLDQNVFLVTLFISLLALLIAGLLPALRASSLAPMEALKEDSGGGSGGLHRARLSSGLAVAQMALSLPLLIGAALLIRTFWNAQQADPGFNKEHVLLAAYDLGPAGYSAEQCIEFNRQVLARLEALPGVQSVTLANWYPLGFWSTPTAIRPEGYVPRPQESMDVRHAFVGSNYLRTMQIPVVAGRDFSPQDVPGARPVAVINQALAQRYWPQQDAVGRQIEAHGRVFTVAGVARNSKYGSLNEDPQPFLYLPILQINFGRTIIHVRVAGDPLAFAPVVESKVRELNADLPLYDVGTLASHVQLANFPQRIAGGFTAAFGFLALILAAIGIYGVVAYRVRQRHQEIGIRMALGAQPWDILRLVLSHGLYLTVCGVGLGLAASLVLTRYLRSQLFNISPTDPLTFTVIALLLAAVALMASYLPGRRAAKVDPMIALRRP